MGYVPRFVLDMAWLWLELQVLRVCGCNELKQLDHHLKKDLVQVASCAIKWSANIAKEVELQTNTDLK